ncbi:MAG: DUF1254 domain-containing protein [Hyphomicrobiales bacterium]
MLTKRDFLISTGALAAALSSSTPLLAQSTSRPGFFKAKDIAEAGYIYGLPIVMNYGVMYSFCVDKDSSQYKGPFNEVHNSAQVFTYKDTAVVTPNSDTPYSMLWLDLRAEPIVISVPAMNPKRYYSVQLCDGNTYNYGYIGSRATGNDPGDYLVVGPGWSGEAPKGIKQVFQSSTEFALTIFRTQLFDPKDIDNVRAIQTGYRGQPLSQYLGVAAPPAPAPVTFPTFSAELAKENFFEFLDFALQFAPAQPNELWIREQLARIGVGPGATFRFRDLSLEDKAEVLLGLAEGKRKVDENVKAMGAGINGWRVASAFGDSAFFHGDWMLRATAAQMGIYGNSAVEAMYPATRSDVDGKPLDGANKYTLTFPADGLPPVNAFWSVTMYDGKSQLLIQNPIDRYLINSPMLPNLKRNADGSVTLYIQNASPGPDKESNWLPSPAGSMYIVMRLYWPKETPPSILPPGKGTWQPPGIVKAS